MSKFKNILRDIIFVSRISTTTNKKLLIITSVILTQVAAYPDIGIIVIFSALIGTLLYAGGMDALRSVMIIGALPFSLVMLLMTIALIKTFLKGRSL